MAGALRLNISLDCSEVIAQVDQQCTLEGRQPTAEEYDSIIGYLRKANAQLLQMNEASQDVCVRLSQEREICQGLLHTKHLEVIQQDTEITKLTATIKGLKEDAAESAKNLDDVLKTNGALLLEMNTLKAKVSSLLNEKDKHINALKELVSSQEYLLSEKEDQINILIKEHRCLVHKSKEDEEIIASVKTVIKDCEHCRCKLRSESEIMQEAVSVPMSNDWLSGFSPHHIPSQPLPADNAAYNKSSLDKLRSDSRMEKKIGLTTTNGSLSKFDLQQGLSSLSVTGIPNDHSVGRMHPVSKNVGSVKCPHIDEEQMANVGKILQTTSPRSPLHCKVKIGRKHCISTSDINICLKCSVMVCHDHLHECHSKDHTVFMKMTNKKTWCYTCKCDPLSNNAKGHNVSSLHKDNSAKKHVPAERTQLNQQYLNYRGDLTKKSKEHYSRSRSKSLPQSPSKTTTKASSPRAPTHHPSPANRHLPTSSTAISITGSNTSSRMPSAGRQSSISTDVTSSTATKYSNSMPSSSFYNSDYTPTAATTYTTNTTTCATKVNVPTLSSPCDNTPLLPKPPPTTIVQPHVDSKQPMDTSDETKIFGGSVANNLLSKTMGAPINKHSVKTKTSTTTINTYSTTAAAASVTTTTTTIADPAATTASITAIVPITSSNKLPRNRPSSPSMPRRPKSQSFDGKIRPYHDSSYRSLPFDPPPFKGLVNAGLSCFFNAAIQGLSRIDQFNKLQTKLYKQGDSVKVNLKKQDSYIHVTIPRGGHGEVSEHLSETITFIRKPSTYRHNTYIDPSTLLAAIQRKYRNSFKPYRQGDAHEVMRCVLDAVRMEEIEKVKRGIREEYTGSESGDIETLQNGDDKLLCKAALHGANKVRTYIDQVVGGELLSVVDCAHCKHRVELIEPFLDISLPIPDKRTPSDNYYRPFSYTTSHSHTLEECLEEYVSEDVLDNDNKFICTKCSGKGDDIQLRNAIKQLKLQTLPKVFIIHLKRFSIDHIVTKNSTHVKYPMILDVGPYCTELSPTNKRKLTLYSLFAVIQHIGTLNFGHYTAYIKMSDGQWYKADDSLVTKVQEGEALKQEAYILFYQQIGNS